MNNEFIPYEQALALKELGFNEECLAGYIRFRGSETFELAFYKYRNVDFNTTSNIYVSAPLYQQVFRWFREKYGLFHSINPLGYNMCLGLVGQLGKLKPCNTPNYGTYEEAELECIKKLIERVKNIL